MKYNGWKNYETWNVALWIANDEGLYNLARDFRRERIPYKAFCNAIIECMGSDSIAYRTPDDVSWNDSAIDID